MKKQPALGDLRVWWIPQIPGKPFHVAVPNPEAAKTILDVLANYDLFQLKHNIKGDYCNAGGLEVLEKDDAGLAEWNEWYDEEMGDDIDAYTPKVPT